MFLYTIYEILHFKVNFKGNRAKRHACASSYICRMAYAITEWSLEATTKRYCIGNMPCNVLTTVLF
jgi:hypothetical protein